MSTQHQKGTDWDGYSEKIAERKHSPEWAVLRKARKMHFDQFFQIKKGDKVLDAGCGHGEYSVFALKQGAKLWAIDTSPAMLKCTSDTCAKEDLHLEDCSLQSVFDIHYPDNYFDVVFCLSVLECIAEPEKAVRELVRVLKPGGQLYLDVCNSNALHWHLLFLVMQLLRAAPKGNMRYFFPSQLQALVKSAQCDPIGSTGQALTPPYSGIYTADLRRFTLFPEWLIRPLDRLYLAIENFTNHQWPFRLICWHYFLRSIKRGDRQDSCPD